MYYEILSYHLQMYMHKENQNNEKVVFHYVTLSN